MGEVMAKEHQTGAIVIDYRIASARTLPDKIIQIISVIRTRNKRSLPSM